MPAYRNVPRGVMHEVKIPWDELRDLILEHARSTGADVPADANISLPGRDSEPSSTRVYWETDT